MKPWSRVSALLFLLSIPGLSSAIVVERLYEAAVPVADQSVQAREAAMSEALGKVLVRVTGIRAAAQLDEFTDLRRSAPRLAQQFRYEQRERFDEESQRTVRESFLWVRFDARAVQRAVSERGVPIWGTERPATLVWVAWDDGLDRGLLDSLAPPMFGAALDVAASQRGLPLVMPLMDLEDRVSIAFTDVWGGFEDRILQASERYQPNTILVGRVFRVDETRWAARWTVYEGDEVRHAESAPGMLDAVVGEGVHWVADQVAARAALLPDALRDGRTRIVVSAVEGLGSYARVLRYLESLSPVTAVVVESVESDRVGFALELRGTEEQLRQVIALGNRLRADEQAPLDGALHYRLLR